MVSADFMFAAGAIAFTTAAVFLPSHANDQAIVLPDNSTLDIY